jgi:NADH:ubiquinone oxidoreductase subunit 6 (subunit J)
VLLVGLLLLAAIIAVVVDTSWPTADVPPPEPTTGDIAEKLFDKHEGFVLPFEIASVLLLAAMIGAIVLVRERKEE